MKELSEIRKIPFLAFTSYMTSSVLQQAIILIDLPVYDGMMRVNDTQQGMQFAGGVYDPESRDPINVDSLIN